MLCRSRNAHLAEILPEHAAGMGGLCIPYRSPLSVVVLAIDQNHVLTLETERETPVASDHDRPVAVEVRA